MKQINQNNIEFDHDPVSWFAGKDRTTFVCKDEIDKCRVFKEVAGKTGIIYTKDSAYLTVTTKARNCVKRIQKMLNKVCIE